MKGNNRRRGILIAGVGLCLVGFLLVRSGGVMFAPLSSGPGVEGMLERPSSSDFRALRSGEEGGLELPVEVEDGEDDGVGVDRIGPEREDARRGERIVHFSDEEAMRRFLERARDPASGLRILAESGRGLALRVGFGSAKDLANALDDGDGVEYNYLASVPMPPQGEVQPGAVGFGANTLDWLGVDGDISQMGSGVRIAVLDTGIMEHPFLSGAVRVIDLAGGEWVGPADGHGTAVASLIAGRDNPMVGGLAPGAELIDVRVADNFGRADVFTIAEGIYAAMDGGASIINISLGAYGDSAVLRRAVEAAIAQGVVIVASSGNEGLSRPAYPAAYPGVVSVGSVDARGEHLNFSNQGARITAPGFEPYAAWSGDQMVSFTGTSGSAPLVSGAIAAAYNRPSVATMNQAVQLVLSQANEAGVAGADFYYGEGILDAGRILRADSKGFADVAVASITFKQGEFAWSPGIAEVLIENRGNEVLLNSLVDIRGPGGVVTQGVSRLEPGEVRRLSVPVSPTVVNNGIPFEINAQVKTAQGVIDQRLDNNVRRLSVGVVE